MRIHLLSIVTPLLLVTMINVGCVSKIKQQVFRSEESIRDDVPGTVLFIPFDTITSEYLDNTALFPEVELSDSFYCEAANNLILYECSRIFTVKNIHVLDRSQKIMKWTSFSNDTLGKGLAAASIRDLAQDTDVEYVLVTYFCSIQQSSVQQDGWRQGKYSGSYERPVTYQAIAIVHVQLWNKDGVLLYEKRARGSSGRPIFYDVLKKRNQKNSTDIINYSKKLFSPPLLRALNQAARNAISLR